MSGALYRAEKPTDSVFADDSPSVAQRASRVADAMIEALVRIQQNRLSKRAQKLRRLLGLKRHNMHEFNVA
jgi:hypothetical protein